MYSRQEWIVALAARHGLPAMSISRDYVAAGALKSAGCASGPTRHRGQTTLRCIVTRSFGGSTNRPGRQDVNASSYGSSVLAETRSDSWRLVERSGFSVQSVKLRSSLPSPSASHQGRCVSGFCRSTSVPDAVFVHCILGATGPGRPAAHRLNDTPSCGRRRGKIR